MSATDIRERAECLITPIVEKLQYEVVEIRYVITGRGSELTVFIHKPGGITLNDCEIVNNALDAPLEENDITDGSPYILNVSSPGLDRPIVSMKDYDRNINIRVVASFIKNIDKKKKLTGVLLSHDETTCVLDVVGKIYKLDKNNIKTMLPYIDLKMLNLEAIDNNG
ncbi:MAG: ribosome maturation factor RimP [Christensenellaceae bacterium]|jgi:ribosome maturation factor RimP|nr:ribosome maturation factor RimP [Christensenellaceae bacterium]